MMTIPMMCNQHQVSNSSAILWVVLNLRSLLLKPCETITLLLWKFCTKQRHSETKRDKADKPYMVFSVPKSAETLHQNINSGYNEK
ncbi:hypothetical protein T4B_6853 [Trichinella pseudospiralis]|uniref:Uncharacterized protein n=1 Tax=Trichinella pseudospiralis TaxID=6337 RepID=A0A0V1HTK7_TRIPS|nr:hypothetical protein T4A_5914 [Trichinella pseudospiralis]KRZ13898.1 hypothetical protein T4B_6853 [Trichinella pseudospiralis]KRZ37052.1 hypothetical protein T4C_7734 [Trichinella pseudospiralis]